MIVDQLDIYPFSILSLKTPSTISISAKSWRTKPKIYLFLYGKAWHNSGPSNSDPYSWRAICSGPMCCSISYRSGICLDNSDWAHNTCCVYRHHRTAGKCLRWMERWRLCRWGDNSLHNLLTGTKNSKIEQKGKTDTSSSYPSWKIRTPSIEADEFGRDGIKDPIDG